MLSFPTSNTAAEREFSSLKLIKTPIRNALKNEMILVYSSSKDGLSVKKPPQMCLCQTNLLISLSQSSQMLLLPRFYSRWLKKEKKKTHRCFILIMGINLN